MSQRRVDVRNFLFGPKELVSKKGRLAIIALYWALIWPVTFQELRITFLYS
jgi:hypothetical protein